MSHVMIIVSPYYTKVTDMLLEGAVAYLDEHGITHEICEVAGALEIPYAAKAAAYDQKNSGAIALGCVIRGETSHYDIVANESARGIMEIGLRHNFPVGNGILTCDTMDQALVRADVNQKNKGRDAAKAVHDMMKLGLKRDV